MKNTYSDKLENARREAQAKRHETPLVHLPLTVQPDLVAEIELLAEELNITRTGLSRYLLSLGLQTYKEQHK